MFIFVRLFVRFAESEREGWRGWRNKARCGLHRNGEGMLKLSLSPSWMSSRGYYSSTIWVNLWTLQVKQCSSLLNTFKVGKTVKGKMFTIKPLLLCCVLLIDFPKRYVEHGCFGLKINCSANVAREISWKCQIACLPFLGLFSRIKPIWYNSIANRCLHVKQKKQTHRYIWPVDFIQVLLFDYIYIIYLFCRNSW